MINIFMELAKNEWNLFLLFFISISALIIISEFVLKKICSNNTNRQIIHITVGIAVSFTPYFFTHNHQPVLLAFIFLIVNFFSQRNNFLKSFHNIERESYGTIFYPISYLLLALLFWDYSNHITISFLILAIADPLASIIGENVKSKISFNILGDDKTLQGSIAMFVCSLVIILILSNHFFNNWDMTYKLLAAIIISIAVTIAEAVSYKGSDNISIPITAFLFVELLHHIDRNQIGFDYIIYNLIIILILFVAHLRRYLSVSGLVGAITMAIFLLGFGGNNYLYPLVVFFITSSALSFVQKENINKKDSNRNINQVFSNGGPALFICIANYFQPSDLLYPCFLASVAAANSDTWGTELGKLSKANPIDIISGKKVQHGTSGGITIIGTIGSLFGSITIGIIGYLFIIDKTIILLVVISGFLSSLMDSMLGSTNQARFISPEGNIITEKYEMNYFLYTGSKIINNDTVNLYCTISGPLILLIFYSVIV